MINTICLKLDKLMDICDRINDKSKEIKKKTKKKTNLHFHVLL